MEDKNLDTRISEALIKGTELPVGMKEQVWRNIQKDLSENGANQSNGRSRVKEPKKERPAVGRISMMGRVSMMSAVAAVILVFFFATQPGQAAVKLIREYLVPEKNITQHLEGQKEQAKVSLHENSAAGYTIYVDKQRYELLKQDGVDRVVPKIKPTGDFPPVFMEINQAQDKRPQAMAAEIKSTLAREFPVVQDMGTVNDPIKSIVLGGVAGNKFNSKVVRYYLVDNKHGGTFVIKQQFFLEAEEGHGARFHAMLKEFRIVENK